MRKLGPIVAAWTMATPAVARGAPRDIDLTGIDEIEQISLADLLDRPVVAASRHEQRASDSPIVVSVIDDGAIAALDLRTIGEAVRTLAGAYLSNDRDYSYLGLRGFSVPGDYNTRILFAVDGHTINDLVYGQAPPGYELDLPMAAVERVELVRGAASSVYGSNSLLGAVQIVTHTGASRPGVHASASTRWTAETGGDRSVREPVALFGQDLEFSYGHPGAVDVFVAADYVRDPGLGGLRLPELAADRVCAGVDSAARPCDGTVGALDLEQAGGVFASMRAGHLTLRGLVGARQKRVPTASFGTVAGDPVLTTLDARGYLDAEWTRQLGAVELMARAGYDHYDYRGTYPYDDGSGAPYPAGRTLTRDGATPDALTAELRGRWRRARLGRHLSDLDLVAGADVIAGVGKQFAYTDAVDGTTSTDFESSDRVLRPAVYAQLDGRVAGRLVETVAVRADHTSGVGVNVSPRVGLMLDGGDRGRLRASYGTSFRAPNLYERFYTATSFVANPDLRSERGRSYEVSFERLIGPHLRVQVAAYRQAFTDLLALSYDANGVSMIENRDGATGRGVEVEGEARWDAFDLRGTYAVQRSSDQDGMRLANSPRSLAGATLIASLAGGRARIGVEAYYVGRRAAATGGTVAPAYQTSVTLTAPHLIGDLDLGLGVHNALDQAWADPGSEEHRETAIPRDPRTVWLRIGAGF